MRGTRYRQVNFQPAEEEALGYPPRLNIPPQMASAAMPRRAPRTRGRKRRSQNQSRKIVMRSEDSTKHASTGHQSMPGNSACPPARRARHGERQMALPGCTIKASLSAGRQPPATPSPLSFSASLNLFICTHDSDSALHSALHAGRNSPPATAVCRRDGGA